MISHTVIRPTVLYGRMTKKNKTRVNVMEIQMLRWYLDIKLLTVSQISMCGILQELKRFLGPKVPRPCTVHKYLGYESPLTRAYQKSMSAFHEIK